MSLSRCFRDLRFVFLDETGRLLAAVVDHLDERIVTLMPIGLENEIVELRKSMASTACFAVADVLVQLPRSASYTVLVQPAGKRFGPITFAQLRSRKWHWSVG